MNSSFLSSSSNSLCRSTNSAASCTPVCSGFRCSDSVFRCPGSVFRCSGSMFRFEQGRQKRKKVQEKRDQRTTRNKQRRNDIMSESLPKIQKSSAHAPPYGTVPLSPRKTRQPTAVLQRKRASLGRSLAIVCRPSPRNRSTVLEYTGYLAAGMDRRHTTHPTRTLPRTHSSSV